MRNERREIKLDGATAVKNSGRGESKGDARLTLGQWDFLIDYKHYENTFSVSRDIWKKLSKDAWNDAHREPVIKVVYEGGIELAILDWNSFVQMAQGDGYEH